jgi:hypothetical protein
MQGQSQGEATIDQGGIVLELAASEWIFVEGQW